MGKRGGKRGGLKRAEGDDEQERTPHALPQVADSPTGGKRGGKRGKRTNNNHNGFSTGAFGIMGEDIGDSSLNQSDVQSPERSIGKRHEAFTDTEKVVRGGGAGFGDGTNSPCFGDHDGQSDMTFSRSRNPSFVSQRDELTNHEFSGSNRSRANSGAFDVHVDSYGSFGPPTGGDIDEDGDGFNDRQFPIRSVQNDEKFVNHRLSKMSISTNADEFVLVGGHPHTVTDGRGSVMSNRSAVSRKSMLRSSDFLATGDTSPDYVTAPGSQFNSGHQSRSTSRSQSRRSSVTETNQFNNNNFGNTGFGVDSHAVGNSHAGSCTNGTTENDDLGGEYARFGGSHMSNRSRVDSHASIANEHDHFGGDSNGFGGNPSRFGGSCMSNRSRTHSHASFANDNGQFVGDSNGFGDNAARFGGSHMSTRSQAASHASIANENHHFGGDSNGFGENASRFGGSCMSNRSRAPSHANFANDNGQFGGDSNGFGDNAARDEDSHGFGDINDRFGGLSNSSRAASHASVANGNDHFRGNSNGFGDNAARFGGSHMSTHSQAASHASIANKNDHFGGDSNGFSENASRFGGSCMSNRSRAPSHANFANDNGQFGGDSNGFGDINDRFGGLSNSSRAASHASVANGNDHFGANSNGFGDNTAHGEDSNVFVENTARFGGSNMLNRNLAPSHASNDANNQFCGDSNVFGGNKDRFGGSNRSNNTRAPSFVNVTDGFGDSNISDAARGSRNIDSSHNIERPNRTESRISMKSLKTDADQIVEVSNNIAPKKPPRSRSSSVNSHFGYENVGGEVGFADIPELLSHPDDKFENDCNDPSQPFRPTREHEKTPPAVVRRNGLCTSNSGLASNSEISNVMQPIPVARPRSVSQSSQLMQQMDNHVISRNPSIRSEMGVPKAMAYTDALTPRSSRISHNQVENSPAVFNQTQFDKNEFSQRRSNLRSDIFEAVKTSCEIAVQTGETIRLRQPPNFLSISGGSDDLKPQSNKLESDRMASFGKSNFNSSFEKKGHPAASVLTSMLQQRVANSTPSSGKSVVSSHTTVIDSSNKPMMKPPIQNASSYHNYDTRTNEKWSSNTRTTWQARKVDENSNVVVDTRDQRHLDNWLHDGAKHIMPKETTDELRMKVLNDSRPPLTPKSSRATGRLDDTYAKSNIVSCRQARDSDESLSYNGRQGARISEQSFTMDRLSTGSGVSPYRWQSNRSKTNAENNNVRKPDARWVEGLVKEPGRTVRNNVRPGKIRDLASMFNQMQDNAVKEASVLVLNSRPLNSDSGGSLRQRRQSEPSLNESLRNEDPIFHDDSTINHRRDSSSKNACYYDNGLDAAIFDVNDYYEPEIAPDRRKTSTPLDKMMDQRGQMAAQFQRIPSIRGDDVRHGPAVHRVALGVRSLAASFEQASTDSRQLIDQRSSSLLSSSSKRNIQRGSTSVFSGSTDHDRSNDRHVSRQLSGNNNRSYSVNSTQKRRVDSYDEEPSYTQIIRVSHSNNVQSPTSKRSSTVSNNNKRTLPKFPDIVEENVNGHIDNLFDFVQEHDENDNVDVGGYSEVSKPLIPPKPLNYSVSGYRERQRTLRVNEGVRHDDPIRFSPTVAPHVGELTNASIRRVTSNKISYTSQPNSPSFGTGHPHSGRSFGATGFSTSTPRGSPHGVHLEDTSFVSSITEGSHRDNGSTDYKRQLNKLQYQIHGNGEQIGMMQKVLTQARKEKKTLQELSAQRTLLVARERVLLLRKELSRVEAMSQIRRAPPPLNRDLKGSMVISNITVMLNKEFYQGHNDMNSSYAFVVLLKCGSEVEATAPVTLLAYRQNRLRQLYFAEKVNFGNLPVDFRIQLEVYAMVLHEQKHDDLSCATNIANKCRNLLIPAKRPVRSVNGLPVGEFIRCGFLRLTRDTTASTTFYLDEAEYPLEGTIEVHSRCSTLPPAIEVDYRGFLTMYQTVSGMSSWERYWAVLRRGSIYFWKYPDDESMERSPKAHLDLTTCTRDEITSCTPDQCPRPYTFSVDILMATAPSVMDRKRIMLSADSRELMNAWLEALNETLAVIRG